VSDVQGTIGVTHLAAPPNATSRFAGIRAVNRAGRTEHFELFYDRVLGETGRSAGATVLNRAERDLATLRAWFGDLTPPSERFAIVLARLPDNARAYRRSAVRGREVTLYCDVATTPRLEALQSSFFVTVQMADVFATAVGWDAATGGALARVLATALYPRRIAGFATGWLWLQSERQDFVSGPLPSGETAMGCAVLFFNYLHHQLGFSWREIAACAAPTLGAAAERLTGAEGDFADFRSLLARHLPEGEPSALATDNPFPLDDDPAGRPAATSAAQTVATGGRSNGRRVERRVCLLIGGSGTLGAYLCEHRGDRYDFAAVYHHRRPSSGVFAIEADLTAEGECERIVKATLDRFGRVDLLVNAAVASTWGPMLESEKLWNSASTQFLTNVVVPFRVSCAAAHLYWRDHVDENRAANRSVINVSSISGQNLFPGEGQSVYAASKAALDHLTGHMALEFAAIGVRVNAIAPNSFPSKIPIERVVEAIAGLDAGDSSGGIVVVDGAVDYRIQLTPPFAVVPGNPSGR
jgi:NAD(P)-dependent dehydrogenase (short-subunit alcohol dehydrogenase family)